MLGLKSTLFPLPPWFTWKLYLQQSYEATVTLVTVYCRYFAQGCKLQISA